MTILYLLYKWSKKILKIEVIIKNKIYVDNFRGISVFLVYILMKRRYLMEYVLSFNEGNENLTPPPPPPAGDPTPTPPPSDVPPTPPQSGGNGDVNVLMVVLAYFGILALIPFFAEKEDEFVQYHAKQGLFLAIAELILFIVVLPILGFIPLIGCVVMILYFILPILVLVFHIIWMVKASKGERFTIPYVTIYAEKMFK